MSTCVYEPGQHFIPPKDPPSGGLPAGGTTGQALVKASDDPGDVTWATIGGGGTPIIIDTALSTTSTNPVQNKAIGQAVTDINATLAEKADSAEVDAELATLSAAIALKADTADLDDYVEKVTGKGLSTNDYTDADKAIVDGVTAALAEKADASDLDEKQDVLTAGQNITITKNTQTGETVISATGGSGDTDKTFVAEYGVTTAQEILAYLDSTKEPFAPILVKRGNTYYTAVISTPGTDRVNLSTFGTISGEGYLFNYTVTGANWSSSNIGFQTKLVSGTSIKTINGESILGSGNIDIQGGVTVDDALSETSLNPVQNRVIYGALESMRQAMTGYLERLAALEAKLADYEETRLQMTDGTNTVDKTVLTKPYVSPIRTMFDLAPGLYDAQGNFLREVSVSTEWDSEYGEYISHLQDTTGAAGVVLPGGYRAIQPLDAFMYDNALDWLVIPDSVEYIGGLGSDYDIGTIYYRGTAEGAPWGQYSATVNTTGTPLYWERGTMFDLPDGLYDAEGNLLFDLTDSEYVAYDMDVDRNKTYRSIDVGSLYDLYPTLCGVVLRCGSGDKYSDFEFYSENTETEGKLKWVVLASGDGDNQSFKDPIWAWQGLKTVYYRGSLTVPVWEQSTTINTIGTPLAWEV